MSEAVNVSQSSWVRVAQTPAADSQGDGDHADWSFESQVLPVKLERRPTSPTGQ